MTVCSTVKSAIRKEKVEQDKWDQVWCRQAAVFNTVVRAGLTGKWQPRNCQALREQGGKVHMLLLWAVWLSDLSVIFITFGFRCSGCYCSCCCCGFCPPLRGPSVQNPCSLQSPARSCPLTMTATPPSSTMVWQSPMWTMMEILRSLWQGKCLLLWVWQVY